MAVRAGLSRARAAGLSRGMQYRASSDLRIVISRRSGGEGGEVSKMHAVIPAIYPLTEKRRRSDGEAPNGDQ